MQRLSRTLLNETNQKSIALLSHYKEIKGILIKHLPPSTVSLFAQPELNQDNTIVSWYTDLEGQPYQLRINESDKKMLATVDSVINQRVQAISDLTKTLQSNKLVIAEQSQLLNELIEGLSHDTKEIYLINNEPVITAWGVGKKIIPPVTTTPAPPVAASAVKHRLCCWLIPLLLLLGAGLFWWWMNNQNVEPAPQIDPVIEVKEESKPVVELPKVEEPKVEEPKVEELPKVEEPKAEELPKVEEPKVEPPQIEEPKEEIPAQTEEAKPPVPVCKTEYKPGEAPQMVIIFDNSASMKYTLAESPEKISDFEYRWDTIGISDLEYEYMTRLPNRLSVAKKSSANIIDRIDKNVDIGLVALTQCPAAHSYGFYSPSKRGALKSKIKKMQPNKQNSGTPLYSGLKQAASMVDGVKREAFILILSDGQDNCKAGNICALASQLAKSKPKLKINVVDIGGAKAANCAAHVTGGKVFTANNPKQVTSMINQAVTPMREIKSCK